MPYKAEDIPGWTGPVDAEAMDYVASALPDSGILVECGTLFGRSLCHWHEALIRRNKIYQYHVIDNFLFNDDREGMKGDLSLLPDSKSALPTFTSFTSHINKTVHCFTIGHDDPDTLNIPQLTCYYENIPYQQNKTEANWDYWWNKLTPGGIMAIHNYSGYWYGGNTALDKFVEEKKTSLTLTGWIAIIPK